MRAHAWRRVDNKNVATGGACEGCLKLIEIAVNQADWRDI
jgi:hypothetical protein